MPEPIKWREKVILAKIESAYGTDPEPTGAANAILMKDVSLQPMEGEDLSRNLDQPWLGNQPTLPASLRAVLSGATELAGSGSTGVAPAWGVLARGAGLAEVVTPDDGPGDGTVVYSPVTSAHESLTIYIWIGPTLFKTTGARVDAVIEVNAQQIPQVRWTITGLFEAPADQSPATPVCTAWPQPLIATDANTTFELAEVPLVMRSFALNLGNSVEPRLLIGRSQIGIADKAEAIELRVEAVPLATFNPFARAAAGEAGAMELELVHGTAPGSIVTINAPRCQMQRPSGFEQEQGVTEWPLRLVPLPTDGNDQFEIVLT